MNALDWIAVGLSGGIAVDVGYIAALIRQNDAAGVAEEQDAADELLRLEREMADHGSFGRNLGSREIV